MKIFTDRFPEIMLNPLGEPNLTQKERTQALITSIVFGILSLGIVHAVCAIVLFAGKKVVHPPAPTPVIDNTDRIFHNTLSSQKFLSEINRTMGAHLTDVQKNRLIECYQIAVNDGNPAKAFEKAIDSSVNTPTGWSHAKLAHIKKNLLPLFQTTPVPNNNNPQLQQIVNIAKSGRVAFYKSGPTEFLGNFSHSPINIWGKTFQCAEAAFQWKKYDLASQNNAALAADPLRNGFFQATGEHAFKIRQQLDAKYPKVFAQGWQNGVRDNVMWEVQQAKYQQNPQHLQKLQATGKAYLLEHNEKARDNYWSDNQNGTGKNILGQMLEAIRDVKPKPQPDNVDPRMQAHTQAVNQQIASNSLGYQIF